MEEIIKIINSKDLTPREAQLVRAVIASLSLVFNQANEIEAIKSAIGDIREQLNIKDRFDSVDLTDPVAALTDRNDLLQLVNLLFSGLGIRIEPRDDDPRNLPMKIL